MKFDYDAMDAEQFRLAIKLLNVLLEMTNDEICVKVKELGGPEIPPGSVSKRKSFPPGFGEALQKIAELLPISDQVWIARKVQQATDSELEAKYAGIGAQLGYSLDQWLGLNDVETSKFSLDCANENGRYLLFRSQDGENLTTARMNIVWRSTSNLAAPGFVTIRSKEGRAEKITRGQAFMLGESIYMIGRIKRDSAIRFSRLRKVTRNQRTDLYGIRLGTSASTERPYAHFIYAYQLRRARGETLKRLASVSRLDDEILDEEIDNIDQIRRLLTASKMEENGLVSLPLEDLSGS